jgi:integrase
MRQRKQPGQPKLDRFEIGGFYLYNPHPERGGYWYACRLDARARVVRRRSLKTTDFEEAKIKLAALVAAAPKSSLGAPSPNDVMTIAVLDAYLEDRGQHIASEEAAERAVQLFTEYLESIRRLDAEVAFWTPSRQLEFARWCVAKHHHSAGYIERLFNVARSAFNDACQVKIRLDAVGNKVEAALMSHAPKIVWKRDGIAKELKIPARRPRPATLSIEQMAEILDHLKTPHLFRFAVMSLCTWARPQAIIDFDPGKQIDLNDGTIDLAPVGWVQTKKRRPRQPLTQCLAGWLTTWHKEHLERQAKAQAEGREPPSSALITYKGKKVATVKRAIRRAGVELGLMGFSQYSFRHFMADQIKKLFRGVPREHRSLWMGHVVRDGSRTTDNYESDDPHVLADVALATDCVIALIQEHCDRTLFAIESLLNREELEKIGARAFPKTKKKPRLDGGRDRDRTCDPYHVKVVLFR